MPLAPESLVRRSFVHRELVARGATFAAVAGAACAVDFGDPEAEAEAARELALCDLSPLPRGGFKGANTVPWLRARGIEVGDEDNRAYRQADGALVARLAPGEVLILAALDGGDPSPALEDTHSMDDDPRTYPVPRAGTSAWFRVTGNQAAPMFAKICGVDLRPKKFAPLRVAQTSVARLNGIVIRDDLGAAPAYHLLADSAAALYLWSCLLDAMEEFAGRVVGLRALERLAKS